MLVVNDPLAPALTAYWKGAGLKFSDLPAGLPLMGSMIGCPFPAKVQLTVDRCKMAGLLVDGGITETAERWLSSLVAKRLNPRARRTAAAKKA